MWAMKKVHLFWDLKILQQIIFSYSQKLEEKYLFLRDPQKLDLKGFSMFVL